MDEKQAYERFTMFDNWGEIFDEMSDEDAVKLFRGMYRYAFYNEEPEFEKGSALSLTWKAIKPNIDSSGKAARNGSVKTSKNTPEKTPPQTPKKTPSEQKKRIEKKGIGKEEEKKADRSSLEKNSYSAGAACSADVEGSTPHSAPKCQLCGSDLERTGMPDPDYWWCPHCKDSYAREKVVT